MNNGPLTFNNICIQQKFKLNHFSITPNNSAKTKTQIIEITKVDTILNQVI